MIHCNVLVSRLWCFVCHVYSIPYILLTIIGIVGFSFFSWLFLCDNDHSHTSCLLKSIALTWVTNILGEWNRNKDILIFLVKKDVQGMTLNHWKVLKLKLRRKNELKAQKNKNYCWLPSIWLNCYYSSADLYFKDRLQLELIQLFSLCLVFNHHFLFVLSRVLFNSLFCFVSLSVCTAFDEQHLLSVV